MTSEGMNFIYAAHKEKVGQDLLYLSSHNMGDTFSKTYSINRVPGEVNAHGENDPLLRQGDWDRNVCPLAWGKEP